MNGMLNGASLEILGSEPLALLLTEHLINYHPHETDPRFNLFARAPGDRKIHLLATVTNLTQGKLSTLLRIGIDTTEWAIGASGTSVFRISCAWRSR